jgi:hypothetical protein
LSDACRVAIVIPALNEAQPLARVSIPRTGGLGGARDHMVADNG